MSQQPMAVIKSFRALPKEHTMVNPSSQTSSFSRPSSSTLWCKCTLQSSLSKAPWEFLETCRASSTIRLLTQRVTATILSLKKSSSSCQLSLRWPATTEVPWPCSTTSWPSKRRCSVMPRKRDLRWSWPTRRSEHSAPRQAIPTVPRFTSRKYRTLWRLKSNRLRMRIKRRLSTKSCPACISSST